METSRRRARSACLLFVLGLVPASVLVLGCAGKPSGTASGPSATLAAAAPAAEIEADPNLRMQQVCTPGC